jgi:hypothetical protein
MPDYTASCPNRETLEEMISGKSIFRLGLWNEFPASVHEIG